MAICSQGQGRGLSRTQESGDIFRDKYLRIIALLGFGGGGSLVTEGPCPGFLFPEILPAVVRAVSGFQVFLFIRSLTKETSHKTAEISIPHPLCAPYPDLFFSMTLPSP